MSRLALVPLLALPLAVLAAPVPKAAEALKEFGAPVDPDKDCTFAAADGALTITAPANHHTLTTTPSRKNAPRVWRDVEGDFTATVRVRADLPDELASDLAGVDPGVAAGLIVWADENNFVAVIRLHELLGKRRVTTNEVHYQVGGEEAGDSGAVVPLDTAPAFLRMTRTGGEVLGEGSKDGKEWKKVSAVEFRGPAKVKVGVFLEHTTGQKVTGTFDKYELKVAKK